MQASLKKAVLYGVWRAGKWGIGPVQADPAHENRRAPTASRRAGWAGLTNLGEATRRVYGPVHFDQMPDFTFKN